MEDCRHGLAFGTCSYCSGRDRAERQANIATARRAARPAGIFPARHPGRCPICRDGIAVGDPIGWDDSEDAYVHAEHR